MITDQRIGSSHVQVPGFDGRKGYGGACFPKDTNAFSKFAEGDFYSRFDYRGEQQVSF